jgi:hypothetical protein
MQFVAYTMIFLLDFNLSDEFYHYTLVYQKFYSIYMERYLCIKVMNLVLIHFLHAFYCFLMN